MDVFLKNQLYENGANYKTSLSRIIDKYSKLQYQDGGIEVDLKNTKIETLDHYMKLSQTELSKLESKSLTDLRNESLRAQDITRHSQLDLTHQDGETDETLLSTSQFSKEDDGMASSDTTQLTEFQPEDQDEELEMTLRSHVTLVELYPSIISQINRAWHRKNVSDAANSVKRRYRRWRQNSNRSNFNKTFVVALRCSNSREMNSKIPLQENTPEKRQFARAECAPLSPLQTVLNLQDWKEQHHSPGRERGLWRTEQQKPVLVMHLSGPSETCNLQEISLNETFTVSEVTQLGEEPYPSRFCHRPAKAALDQSLRSKRPFVTAHSDQAVGCSVYVSETDAVKPDIYGSPVRTSPLKTRVLTSFSGSPHSFSRSPQQYCVESFSRETARSQLLSTSLSSPLLNHAGKMRMLDPQDSNPPIKLPSLESARAGHVRLPRQLSFDSSHVSCSPKTVDDDFKKLYHKFVCQNNGPSCRLCAGNSGSNYGQSSALAALALSPHRLVLRKRCREVDWDRHSQSKRIREEEYTVSPGSKHHGKEMLRHHMSSSEPEQYRDDFSYSSSKPIIFPIVRPQQHSADTWKSHSRLLSAAEFSGLGGMLKNSVANSYSPRGRKL